MLIAILLALAALPGSAGNARADDRPSLKVDPASVSVQPGQEFTLRIYQVTTVDTTGAQVNVNYDPALLQLKDFSLGPAYTCSNAVFAFGNADLGTSGNKDLAIGRANKFGTLENAAGFLLPGSGTLVAGSSVFLTLRFVAQRDVNGQANIGLLRGSLIDANGGPMDPHLLNGTVIVGTGAAPAALGSTSPSGAPSASGSPAASIAPGASGSPLASGSPAASDAPGASSSPGESGGPLPSEDAGGCPGTQPAPGGSGGPAPSVEPPVSPTTPVGMSLAPTSLTLKNGDQARVFIIANSNGDISSVTADLSFDPGKLEVLSLEPGPAWGAGTLIAVASGATRGVDGAIAEANKSGVLQQAGAFFAPGVQALPYGEGVVVSAIVRAKADGTSNLSIGNAGALGVSGEKLTVTVEAASLTKPPDKGLQLDPTLVIPLALLAILVGGFVFALRTGRIPVRVRRRWPYYLTMGLGLIPVVLFVGIVLMMVAKALPVIDNPGIPALFGAPIYDVAGQAVYRYNILPAVWGTVMVTVIAVAIALPISLILAIAAVDFPMGLIGRLVRPVIGVLSGVPPIVYAVSFPVFVISFMIPKFAGNMDFSQFQNGGPAAIGADPATWPPPHVPYSAGGFPWSTTRGDASSVVLGGLIVALFIIPFLTPLLVDALRDVPRAGREASLALGANRTYTLRRVVLPRALPAMAGAATLATLKAMGDAVIVLFVVGAEAVFPSPPFDALERAAPIGSWASNLIGSFETLDDACKPADCATGYAAAFVLLLVAVVFVLIFTSLQARSRRRLAV